MGLHLTMDKRQDGKVLMIHHQQLMLDDYGKIFSEFFFSNFYVFVRLTLFFRKVIVNRREYSECGKCVKHLAMEISTQIFIRYEVKNQVYNKLQINIPKNR